MSNIYDASGNLISGGSTVPNIYVSDVSLNEYDKICKSINHRGYRAGGARENTLAAFRASKAQGFYYVETDVMYTSDNVAILQHDSYVTYNGTSTAVSNLTYAQMLEVHSDLAIFEDFIALCRNIGLHPYIELKNNQTQAQIQALVDTVHAYQMQNRVTWFGGNANVSKVQAYDPNARLGILANTLTSAIVAQATALKLDTNEVFLDTWIDNLTSEILAMVQEAGLPLELYTFANNASEITGMDPYITGFTCDQLIAGKVLYDANIA